MGSEPVVQVSGLHRRYGALHAVRGVDLALRRGEVLGLLGANGAGKTTTMAMLAGVLSPDAGRIRIAGHDLLAAPLAAKARLGYLPESPPLFPELTVDEYLVHCARLRGLAGRDVSRAVARASARCGLGSAGRRLLGTLSKGYRQRAGIAQAIVHDPDVVILDEPTAGLDPEQLREVRELVRELGEQRAVIFSTHLLPEVQSLCTRVHIIHQGLSVFTAAMADLAGPASRFRLRLARPPGRAALAALDGVTRVTELADGAFEVALAGGDDGAERLAGDCVRAGYGLRELTPARQSLEELFIEVCHRGAPASTHADPGAAGP